MISALIAEFRKIFTVRSTWVILVLAFLFGAGLIGFWIYGYQDVGKAVVQSNALFDSILSAIGFAGLVLSFIMILLVGHEYRYNTIMYSLTSSRSRSKVFFSKFLAGAIVMILFGSIIVALNALFFYIGQGMNDTAAVAQHVPLLDIIWRGLVVLAGYAAFAFIISMLLRSQIGAIATFLLLPSTIEGILSLLLKENTKYLPFTALSNLAVLNPKPELSFSLLVVAGYVAVLGFVSWLLFMRRDAN